MMMQLKAHTAAAVLSFLLLPHIYWAGGPRTCSAQAGDVSRQTHSQSMVQLSASLREKVAVKAAELAESLSLGQAGTLSGGQAGMEDGIGLRADPTCANNGDCGWHATCSADGQCAALPLFAMPWADVLFGALSFFIAGVSLAAGVGGGGLFVPMLMLLLSFDARMATGLSQSMLFGGAVAAFAYNMNQRHPSNPAKPLIDFELACLLGPALMAGAQVGSLVHAVAPPAVLLFLLCFVLLDAARKGVASALKIRAKELADAEARMQEKQEKLNETPAAKTDEPAPEPSPVPSQDAGGRGTSPPAPSADDGAGQAGGSGTTEAVPAELSAEEEEAEMLARVRGAQIRLLGLWVFTCAVVLAKGLFLDICTAPWWSVLAVSVVCLTGFALHYAGELSRRTPAGEDSMNFKELAFPLVRWSIVAGILAALCGIGGGMVMGPILVALRVPPPVSAATTATTLLLISSSTALVYASRGLVPHTYSLYLSAITATGAYAGKSIIGGWVRRTGRDSVIVWCLAGITVLSTLLMGALGLYRVSILGRQAFALSSLCDLDHHLHGPTSGVKTHS